MRYLFAIAFALLVMGGISMNLAAEPTQQAEAIPLVDPNESCKWRGIHTCPMESSGSYPVCDNTNPAELTPGSGIYALKVCAAETPKAVGGNFDIGIALYGEILTVDVIPSEEGENNSNCSDGSGSVGQRVFSAHCEVKGPGKIRGYWAITFKMPKAIKDE